VGMADCGGILVWCMILVVLSCCCPYFSIVAELAAAIVLTL